MEGWIAGVGGMTAVAVGIFYRRRFRRKKGQKPAPSGLYGWYPYGTNPYDPNTPEPPHFMTNRLPPTWRQEPGEDT